MSRVVIIDYFVGGKTTLANQLGNLLEILNEMEEN